MSTVAEILDAIRAEYLPEEYPDATIEAYNEAVRVCYSKVRRALNQTDDWAAAPGSPASTAAAHAIAAQSSPRRFQMVRNVDVSGFSGTGVVIEGVVWTDGSVSCRWRGDYPSTVAWDNVEQLIAVHGHDGATVLEWLDPEDKPIDLWPVTGVPV